MYMYMYTVWDHIDRDNMCLAVFMYMYMYTVWDHIDRDNMCLAVFMYMYMYVNAWCRPYMHMWDFGREGGSKQEVSFCRIYGVVYLDVCLVISTNPPPHPPVYIYL